jgi:2-polyprenyl-3-methyl-5-hydroxy-6-metoxy-1,4-benzoquinol methylase
MTEPAAIRAIAACFPRRWDHHYAAAKLRTDPLYPAVLDALRGSPRPLLDLGCGIGLLAFFLRAHGHGVPIHGLDYDSRKIDSANTAKTDPSWAPCTFSQNDARDGLPAHSGDVTILDILQFFNRAERTTLLQAAAARVATGGGVLVIRSGLRDDSLRHRITVAGDILAKISFWMKAAPTDYPTADEFRETLSPFGDVAIRPLWGRTPFNNHLIVLQR